MKEQDDLKFEKEINFWLKLMDDHEIGDLEGLKQEVMLILDHTDRYSSYMINEARAKAEAYKRHVNKIKLTIWETGAKLIGSNGEEIPSSRAR